jgi:shikimate dehydrogenase
MDRLRLGLVGWPVAHSLSPRIHRAFMAQAGIDGSYRLIPLHPDRTGLGLRRLWLQGMDGLNVTAPCKRAAQAGCSFLSETALEAGAVNTLERTSEGWKGHNTDIAGFRALAEDAEAGGPFLVVGCGGAAGAVAAACRRMGADVTAFCRRPESFSGPGRALPLERLEDYIREGSGTLVNATPLGWRADDPFPVAPSGLRGLTVLDLGYSPFWAWRSQAAAAAARLLTGERMLVCQAAESFSIWTGRRPSSEAVLDEVAGLSGRGRKREGE